MSISALLALAILPAPLPSSGHLPLSLGHAKPPTPRTVPVAKLLGKSPAEARTAFVAVAQSVPDAPPKSFKVWNPPSPPVHWAKRPDPDSLSDLEERVDKGEFYVVDARKGPTYCFSGGFVEGRIGRVTVDAPVAWTWQRHLRLAGLSPTGVRVRNLGDGLTALEGVASLPAGTTVTRTTRTGMGGSRITFQLPRKRPRTVRLDEICVPSKVAQEWEQPRRGLAVEGTPLQIADRTFDHGIGTHAVSRIAFDLDGGASALRAWVGVDDATGPEGSVLFRVLGDGVSLWDSGVMKVGEPAKRVDISLKGVKRLELVAEDGGDGSTSDHANWALAVVDWTRDTGGPVFVPTK